MNENNNSRCSETNQALRSLTKRILAVGKRSNELLSYQQQGFSELHAHLLGMGNAKFWLFVVMGWREMERTTKLGQMQSVEKWVERISQLQFKELGEKEPFDRNEHIRDQILNTVQEFGRATINEIIDEVNSNMDERYDACLRVLFS